jgi:hypothetical protein
MLETVPHTEGVTIEQLVLCEGSIGAGFVPSTSDSPYQNDVFLDGLL